MAAEADQSCACRGTSRNGYRIRKLITSVDEPLVKPVDGLRTPHVWLDATYTKCRRDRHVVSTAVVTALDCNEDGYRAALDRDVTDTESHACNPAMVRAMYHEACDMLADLCPRAAETLEDAKPDALAYLSFPVSHWSKLRTNNCSECTNRENKRRTSVV